MAELSSGRSRTVPLSLGAKIGWLLAVLVLLLTGGLGVNNGVTEWPDAHTALQRSVTGGVLVYGLVGIAAGAGLALRKRWSVGLALAWAILITYVSGAAVVGYGGEDAPVAAAIPASLASALIGGLVTWAARVATRRDTPID